jgi:uncharacterized integral membrane protein
MNNFKLSLGILGITLVIIFSLQNAELLTVNFLFWSFELRRAIVLFLVLFVGFATGWIFHGWPRRKRSGQERPSDQD